MKDLDSLNFGPLIISDFRSPLLTTLSSDGRNVACELADFFFYEKHISLLSVDFIVCKIMIFHRL